jgi:hypothetical protein
VRESRSRSTAKYGQPVKPATIRKDLDFLRLVLRQAKQIEKCRDEQPEFPSFRGKVWEVIPSPHPFLDHEQWVRLCRLGTARVNEPGLNPRTKRQQQELYWFLLISVGADLRAGEDYSLRWRDCELIRLNDSTHTEVVHMSVLGKHSRRGRREEVYVMFGAVSAFKAMRAARPNEKPNERLFTANHREGVKELLIKAALRTNAEGRTRDSKSLRQTEISLRLDLGPNPDYRDIAKWALTSPAMIATFYDQTHPQLSVERIVGFRKHPSGKEDQAGE